MHMICNERAKDTFDAVHSTVIASIKVREGAQSPQAETLDTQHVSMRCWLAAISATSTHNSCEVSCACCVQ